MSVCLALVLAVSCPLVCLAGAPAEDSPMFNLIFPEKFPQNYALEDKTNQLTTPPKSQQSLTQPPRLEEQQDSLNKEQPDGGKNERSSGYRDKQQQMGSRLRTGLPDSAYFTAGGGGGDYSPPLFRGTVATFSAGGEEFFSYLTSFADTAIQIFNDVVDLHMIKDFVDLYYGQINTDDVSRSDVSVATLRESARRQRLVVLLGALLDKQSCRQKFLCSVGKSLRKIPIASIFVRLVDKFIPQDWTITQTVLKKVRSSLTDKDEDYCLQFKCTAIRNNIIEEEKEEERILIH